MLLSAQVRAAVPPEYYPPAMPLARHDALLPWSRVVTYYGNPLSKRMGILGELPPDEMMAGLEREAEVWRKADPLTPVKPGLELVATVASDTPGPSGMYRSRMPDALIRKVIGLCQEFGWRLCVDGHWREARQYYRHKPSSAGRGASMNNVIDLNGFGKKHESPLHPVGRRCGDA